jgi:hypothetical protein
LIEGNPLPEEQIVEELPPVIVEEVKVQTEAVPVENKAPSSNVVPKAEVLVKVPQTEIAEP